MSRYTMAALLLLFFINVCPALLWVRFTGILEPLFPIKCLIRVQPSRLQVLMQRIKPALIWSLSWPLCGHLEVKASLSDSVTFCAENVVVPSQKSSAQFVNYRVGTKSLPNGVAADSHQTSNSGRPSQRISFHTTQAIF
ncbi:unnamed protein product [Heligmosomoides polygyrus]|uniref:Secreted protein n=1 Tax=Heligmosomoides polygyrus TaxID=6339 RepID=A0A183FNU5_HELPZ|nr:unnamed protein product [Heligmosomoides polygyrus]